MLSIQESLRFLAVRSEAVIAPLGSNSKEVSSRCKFTNILRVGKINNPKFG